MSMIKKVLAVLFRPSTIILALFLFVSIASAVVAVESDKELADVKKNGVSVTAEVTDFARVKVVDTTEYDVTFTYEYDGETYTFTDRRTDKKYELGDTTTAYLYSHAPETLYFNESFSVGWSILILVIGLITFVCIRLNGERMPEVL